METYDSHPGDSLILFLCTSTCVSADVFLRLLLDMPHNNYFTSRRVDCCGSNRTTKGAYYAFSSRCVFLCPRESTALLAAPESCRGLRCPASLFLAKSIIAAPPMAQKDLQVSKNARSLSILTSLGALNCRWTAL